MKHKLSINTLAMGNLRNRRKQYTIMILGIIMAMFFTSTMIFFLSSFIESTQEQKRNQMGLQSGIICDGTDSQDVYPKLQEEGLIAEYGIAHILGYAYHKDENLGTCIGWLDETAMKLAYHKLEAGTLPEKDGEIALEHTALMKLGYGKAKVGDTIKVVTKIQNGSEYYKEKKQSYKLTGILKDKKKRLQEYQGGGSAYEEMLVAGLVAPGTKIAAGGKEKVAAYYLNGDTVADENSIWKYCYNLGMNVDMLQDYSISTADLLLQSEILFDNLPVILLLIVLVITACTTIVTAFGTNLRERRRQIGLLRAVGATRNQIIQVFGREALIISLIALPVSLLFAYGAVRILLPRMVQEPIYASGLKVLFVCALVNLLVTMLAALLPLSAAAKITPVQGIRDISSMRVMKQKKVKSAEKFSMSSLMAKRNIMFYKNGRMAVTLVLIVSILVSCYGFSMTRFAADDVYQSRYDYTLYTNEYLNMYSVTNWSSMNKGFNGDDIRELEGLPYVSEVIGIKNMTVLISVDEYTPYHMLAGENNRYAGGRYNLMGTADAYKDVERMKKACKNPKVNESYEQKKKNLGIRTDYLQSELTAWDAEGLKLLEGCLSEGSIDLEQLANGSQILMVASPRLNFGVKLEKYQNDRSYSFYPDTDVHASYMEELLSADCIYHAGDELEIGAYFCKDEEEEVIHPEACRKVVKKVTIGGILDPDKIAKISDRYMEETALLTSTAGIAHFYPELKYSQLNLLCESGIGEEQNLEMTEFMTEIANQYDGYVRSVYALNKESEDFNRSLVLCLLCMIILAMVICCSIINNTMTATIREKKRMLGTLRAVGASRIDLVFIYVKQLNYMFCWGIGLGCVVTAAFFLQNYRAAVSNPYRNMTLSFYPWPTILMLLLLYGICAWNLWRTIGREVQNSIVENIREL